jgi:hypothetical protein
VVAGQCAPDQDALEGLGQVQPGAADRRGEGDDAPSRTPLDERVGEVSLPVAGRNSVNSLAVPPRTYSWGCRTGCPSGCQDGPG